MSPDMEALPLPLDAESGEQLHQQMEELDLKVNVALRLLGRFASLHRRWPANPIYLELIRGLEAHLAYWEEKRQGLKARMLLERVGG